MSPVGGSRFYQGGGLGVEAGWACPSCGADNSGPIAGGCGVCGAGKPGRHIGTEPPPPPPPPDARQAPETPDVLGQTDLATEWAVTNPHVSIEEAYRTGYLDGARAMRLSMQQPNQPEQDRQTKIARTIVAALSYFADQVLRGNPEEVTRGEWCSVAEVRQLIEQLTTTGEVAHA